MHLASDGDTDRPKSTDLIFVLREELKNLARADRCDATALVFNVSIALPGSGRKSDAIQACLDHRGGYSTEVFFAYEVVVGEVIYGETFAQQGKCEMFLNRPFTSS